MASSPRESKYKNEVEALRRKYIEIYVRQLAQGRRKAYLDLLFGRPNEDGYFPCLVTPSDLKPSGLVRSQTVGRKKRFLKPVETPRLLTPSDFLEARGVPTLDDAEEAAEKPKS
ncbi:unnamed protein product [Microthlaspi erraticum]|uniref:Uncharacterized protein n=1 Tax=Microthlaspi erraticum TaxID=1685480 RepID=A0A6D2JQ21_9BRAS|nr:unnamed protein product [Microthlaspi erraticum]CAA7043601.1 unnamed protein product [Microthlaspi erraticum]CAA7051189.1 unnamed protein product [Microthlaspi erraticum]